MGACAALYVALTAFLAWRLPLWRDEIYTLRTTAGGPWEAARTALTFDLQAPGYFVLEAVWRAAFPQPLAARVPSLVFGAAAVAVGAAIFVRVVPSLRAGWGAALMASSPLVVWAGTEARWYSLVVLLAACFTLLTIRVHLEGWTRGRGWLILCGAVSLYVQYYLGFLLLAAGVGLLLARPRELWAFILEMLAVLVLAAPLMAVVAQQLALRAGDGPPRSVSLGGLLFSVESNLAQLAFGTTALAGPGALARSLRWAIRLACLAGIAGAVWRARRDALLRATVVLVASLALFSLVTGELITSLTGLPWYLRYTGAYAAPALVLPVLASTGFGRRAALVTVVVLTCTGAYMTFREHRTLGRWGDSRAVARAIEAEAAPGEPILIVPADALLSIEFYYPGPNKLEPVPRAPTAKVWRFSDMMPRGPEDLAAVLRRAGAPASFWLYSDMPEIDQALVDWLTPAWRESEHLRFPGGRYGNGAPAVAHLRHFVRP